MGKRVSVRNAAFQQWQSLLTNRTKRQRTGEFLVHGVRPITLAVEHGWPLTALLRADGRRPSDWARGVLSRVDAPVYDLAPDLLAELSERDDDTAELVAVAALAPDDLTRIPAGPSMLVVAFDRPTSPGNIGTLTRSCDALGAAGLIVTGHAADVYDPKAVRASTGSLFALPVVRAPAPADVATWVTAVREAGTPLQVIGTDEHGPTRITDVDLTAPTLLVIGNETTGMSTKWHTLCDTTLHIPIGGAASSLNAATAGTLTLYEAARQRSFPTAR
ncbi:TrmH family RNA methyltransferase [Actinokineospora bangkokensis]|uniref:rRNA methyltransferase n=1 Tax=Actinokineospora bangkokensis TaxID=1193682 RepID=A0A1Q9LRF7_9PSEU|nr:TrmH family RNA methyltransferase [Actinokineospora bangkokensis]OLR94598.1 rRNA methyltransferase [Actinokineospora bangkokensis]